MGYRFGYAGGFVLVAGIVAGAWHSRSRAPASDDIATVADTSGAWRRPIPASLLAPEDFACYLSRAPRFDPEAREMKLENAYWLALVSWLVYFDQNQAMYQSRQLGFRRAEYLQRKVDNFGRHRLNKKFSIIADTQAMWLENDDYAVLVFGGTEIDDGGFDVKTDLLGFKQKMGNFGHVHMGFYGALRIVWRQVVERIRGMDHPKPIFVTGHSLGGALAMISGTKLLADQLEWKGEKLPKLKKKKAARDPSSDDDTDGDDEGSQTEAPLSESEEQQLRDLMTSMTGAPNSYWLQGLYTFGAPSVGNGRFVKTAETLYALARGELPDDGKDDTFSATNPHGFASARLVNLKDPIPVVSPRLMGFRKTHDVVLFNGKGQMFTDREGLRRAPRSILKVIAPFKTMNAQHWIDMYLHNIATQLTPGDDPCYRGPPGS